MNGNYYSSKNVTMCRDGKYRWVYEMNLYKSTAIIKEVGRVMFISIVITVLLIGVISLFKGDSLKETLLLLGEIAGMLSGILLVLVIVGYLIYAFSVGGKYCVLFEMDEEGINHKQQARQVKKSELIGAIAAIAGIAAGRPGMVGTGILAASRTSMHTYFDSVKELEILPKEHLIRLNETLSRNQVYAEDEDFAFVADYIKSRCRNARVEEGG